MDIGYVFFVTISTPDQVGICDEPVETESVSEFLGWDELVVWVDYWKK